MFNDIGETLEDTPSTRSNWGADELGALNYPIDKNFLDVGVPLKTVHGYDSPVDPIETT